MRYPHSSRVSLARKVLPKEVLAELKDFLEPKLPVRTNGGSTASKTRSNKSQIYLLMFAQLWQLDYSIRSIRNIRPDHIQSLLNLWKEQGISAGEIHNRVSCLNHLLTWVGKENLQISVDEAFPLGEMQRTTIAKENKSWVANGVDVGEILQQAYERDERLACIIAMSAAFGLRAKEAIEIIPERARSEGLLTDSLLIEEGTKGGRPRHVQIQTDEQRQVLMWAIHLAAGSQSKRLRWPRMTWKRAQSYFYYHLRALGITNKSRGVTLHGLRHQFAQNNYRFVTGLPTPVEGGALDLLNKFIHRTANQFVSSQLGHCREDIGATYYGSYGHSLRGIPDVPTGQPLKEENTPLATDVVGTEGAQT
jgi:site-specific recombinase XerD